MRNLRVLGIVLVAALAIAAVAAQSAFASYHSEVDTTNIKGQQNGENVLTTDVGNVQCTSANFGGSVKGATKLGVKDFTAATLDIDGTYGKATGIGKCVLGAQAVEISTLGCTYEFPTAVSKVASKVQIGCVGGKNIVIKDTAGLKCEVLLGTQTTGGSVSFSNLGSGAEREVQATSAMSGITYSWTAGCPNAKGKAGKNTNGTYTGKIDLEAEDPATKKQVGFWVE
jgi:hypothetical protein